MCESPTNSRDMRPPEQIIAAAFKADLGVEIEPQELRMFLRHRWTSLAPLAHKIHDAT